MDPNDQNQQQPAQTVPDQPVQNGGVDQPSSGQPTYQAGDQQGAQEPVMAGPAPMPQEPEVGVASTEPSQSTTGETGIAQPPAPEVPQTPTEQVNPVESSVQYGGGASTEPQGGESGDNNPPQGI